MRTGYYLLDGERIRFTELIKRAQEYEDDGSGLYTTSNAARILEEHGHVVEEDKR